MEPRRSVNARTLGADADVDLVVVEPAWPPGKEGPHLPWTQSMAGPEFPMHYMPFMEHMLNVLAQAFGGQMTALPVKDKLAFVQNEDKQARMLRCVCACICDVQNVLFCHLFVLMLVLSYE